MDSTKKEGDHNPVQKTQSLEDGSLETKNKSKNGVMFSRSKPLQGITGPRNYDIERMDSAPNVLHPENFVPGNKSHPR